MLTFAPSSDTVCLYECLVLLPLELADHALQQEVASIEQLFSEKGGKLLHKEDWGRQGLAYPIRKHREGRFVLFVYELPPDAAPALDAALRLEKGILRHLLTKTPKHYALMTFTERTETWHIEQERSAQKEEESKEERLKQRIVKRAMKVIPPASGNTAPEEEVKSVQLEEELGKIISDKDLHL